MNRGTAKVLAHPTYVCDTYTHVYVEIEVAAYQKACCRSCINVFSEQKCNINQSRAWRNNCRSYQKRRCVYFVQLWVISKNIWPSAAGSRFA